jgi:hypothetical protein
VINRTQSFVRCIFGIDYMLDCAIHLDSNIFPIIYIHGYKSKFI